MAAAEVHKGLAHLEKDGLRKTPLILPMVPKYLISAMSVQKNTSL